MKRIILGLCLVFVLLLVFTSCGKRDVRLDGVYTNYDVYDGYEVHRELQIKRNDMILTARTISENGQNRESKLETKIKITEINETGGQYYLIYTKWFFDFYNPLRRNEYKYVFEDDGLKNIRISFFGVAVDDEEFDLYTRK